MLIGCKLPAMTTHVDALIVEVNDGIVAITECIMCIYCTQCYNCIVYCHVNNNIIIIGYKLPAVTTHVDALIVEVNDGIIVASYISY